MQWPAFLVLTLLSIALLRFQCSQLVVQRLNPLVAPAQIPPTHLHQIVGGNAFNFTMDPKTLDIPTAAASCTSCSFSEGFSNSWTAVLFFKARNGTYKCVPQISQITGATAGIMVYYMQDALYDTKRQSKATAFKPGSRMFVGDPTARFKVDFAKFRQLTYTCMANSGSRSPETSEFPSTPCAYGTMANSCFPTCWDGVNLGSPNHMDYMAYPVNGTFESQAPCPDTNPARMPQVLFEVVWDTSKFNNKADWPIDGTQPFVWSFGDGTVYGHHADYMFGWKGDALQRLIDDACVVSCPAANVKTQGTAALNKCVQQAAVKKDVDGWLTELPGGHVATYS